MELTRDWCNSCGWWLVIARKLEGIPYCRTCSPHAHIMAHEVRP